MNLKNAFEIPTRNSNPNFEYNYFSIFKFIFIILIAVIHHNNFNPSLINTSWLYNFIYQNGHELIYLFFIMSGILFYKITLNKINNNQQSFSNFIKKTFIRFYPLLIVTTITMFTLNYVFFNKFGYDYADCSRDPIKLILNLIFGGQAIFGLGMINNSPLWFLNVLLLMYPLAYLISKLGKKYNFIYIFLCALGIAMLYSDINVPFFNLYVGKGLFGFFLGMILAILLDKTRFISKKNKLIIRLLWVLPIIAFIILVSLTDIHSIRGNTLLFTFLLFIPLIGLLYDIKSVNKICSYKVFLILERLSIGVFFWNYPILLIFHLGFNNTIPSFATTRWFTLILLIVNIAFALFSIYIYKIIGYIKQLIKDKRKMA